MYKIDLYLPIKKSKIKNNIRGFWLDNNKIFYDYIYKLKINYNIELLNKIKSKFNQACLFFTDGWRAYLYNTGFLTKCYKHKKIYKINKNLKISQYKRIFKYLLNIYGGFTLYINSDCYIIEVWH